MFLLWKWVYNCLCSKSAVAIGARQNLLLQAKSIIIANPISKSEKISKPAPLNKQGTQFFARKIVRGKENSPPAHTKALKIKHLIE